MQVIERMLNEPKTIDADASLVEAAHAMLDEGVGFLPVVHEGRLVGVITDRDLVVRGLAENRNPIDTEVHELMSLEVVCCFADRETDEAKALMEEHNLRRLPVIDHHHHLLGILSRKDVGLTHTPKKAPVKVIFKKEKTDGYGRPRKVTIKAVYITGAKDKDAAVAAAVKQYKEEEGTDWQNVADEIDVQEGNAPERRA